MKKILPFSANILVFGLLLYSCSERHSNQPLGNSLPETHLSIVMPDTVLPDTSTSMQIPHWWGSDPDGEVMGYLVRWNYFDDQPGFSPWFWTTQESDTFFVPIRTPDSSFSIQVRAVDNSAVWDYPDGIYLNTFDYEVFFDNGTVPGFYDPGDVLYSQGNRIGNQADSLYYSPDSIYWTTSDNPLILYPVDIEHLRKNQPVTGYIPIPTNYSSAVDQSPAQMTFPIRNSLPTVAFKYGSNPDGAVQDTAFTFPYRTFIWEAQDLDGQNTIVAHYWALDDTTVWDSLPGSASSIVLTPDELVSPSVHTFFLKTKDIAGAFSNIIQFPDTSNTEQPGTWFVQEPVGEVLLIDDDIIHESALTDSTRIIYQNILQNIAPGGLYSVWDIEKSLPYSESDILGTMYLFPKVIWFADASSQLGNAESSISNYIQGGDGHLLITTSDLGSGNNYDNPPFTFLGIDSVTYDIWRFWPGDSLVAQVNDYQNLRLSGLGAITHLETPKGFGFAPADSVEVVYKGYSAYTPGDPILGIRWPMNDSPTLLFIDMYLYRANGNANLENFFDFILNDQFEN